jgi:hydrogenase/urease accessory protein HupE
MKSTLITFLLALLLMCFPSHAYAHLVSTRFGEFYNGMLHPTTTLLHALPWLTLGFLAVFQPLKHARMMTIVFPLALMLGVMFASLSGVIVFVEYINLASILVLGTLVVMGRPMPTSLVIGLTVLFGLSHGHANANLTLAGSPYFLYLCGVMLAAYLSMCLISAGGIVITNKFAWGRTAIRAGGSWILAVGIIFSGFTLISI